MKILKNILFFHIGLLLSLFLIEVFLVVGEVSKSNWTILTPNLGKTNKPSMKIIYYSEGFYIGKINSYGYVGPSYPKEKPGKAIRIILNGDSYVEGLHVFDRYHFRTLIENKLNEVLTDSVQVLNFGKGIFDFYDMYCYQVNYTSQFNPDINLIFVHNIDFKEDRDDAMPYCVIENDSLKINNEFKNSNRFKDYNMLKPVMESAIGRLGFNCYKQIDNAPSIIFDKFYSVFNKPVVMKQPFPIDFTDEAKGIIDILSKDKRNVIVYWDRIQDNIKKYINDAGIKTIDLSEGIKKEEENGHNLEYWAATNESGHFNHEGHKVISELLINNLLKDRYFLSLANHDYSFSQNSISRLDLSIKHSTNE